MTMQSEEEDLVELVDLGHQTKMSESIVDTLLAGATELTLGEVVRFACNGTASGDVAAKMNMQNLFDTYVAQKGYVLNSDG